MNRAIQDILRAIGEHTESIIQMQTVHDVVTRMRTEGESADAIELALAQILLDGLQHGYWPWNS